MSKNQNIIKFMTKTKLLLILKDISETFYFFRRPLAKLKKQTIQQTNRLAFFLTILIISIGVFRVSLDNQDFSMIQNFPILSKKKKTEILQKFETSFLQSSKNITQLQKQSDKREDAAELLYQKLSKKKQNFFDFYEYLEDRAQRYQSYNHPFTFNRIVNKEKKKETINLYRNFEQMDFILYTELKKEQKTILENYRDRGKSIISDLHYYIDLLPFLYWNADNNFDIEKYRKVLSWNADEGDLEEVQIKDSKKEDYLDKCYKMIQKVYPQYQNYIKTKVDEENNANEDDEINLLLNKDQGEFPKVWKFYGKDRNNLFFQTKLQYPYSLNWASADFMIAIKFPLTAKYQKLLKTKKKLLHELKIQAYIKSETARWNRAVEEHRRKKKALLKKLKKEKYTTYHTFPGNIRIPETHYSGQSFIHSIYGKDIKKISKTPAEKAKIKRYPQAYDMWKNTKLVSGYESSIGKRPLFYKDKNYSDQKIPNKKFHVFKLLKQVGKGRGYVDFYPRGSKDEIFLRSDWHARIFRKFESKLPPKLPPRKLPRKLKRIEVIEDRIPLKIQGFKDNPKKHSPGERLLHLIQNKKKPQQAQILGNRKSSLEQARKRIEEMRAEVPKNLAEFRNKFPPKKPISSIFDITFLKNPSNLNFNRKHSIALYKFLELLVEEIKVREFKKLFKSTKTDDLNDQLNAGHFSTRFIIKMTKDGEKFIELPKDLELNSIKANIRRLKESGMDFVNIDPPFFFDDHYDFLVNFFGQYVPLNLREHTTFQEWCKDKANTNQRTFDKFFGKSSPLLAKQRENYYFNKILNSEDYLLEAIFNTFQQKNVETEYKNVIEIIKYLSDRKPKTNKKIKNKKTKKKTELLFKQSLLKLFPEECNSRRFKKVFSPSDVTLFILNFLNFRKNQRELFLKNTGMLLKIKENFKNGKDVQVSFLNKFIYDDFNGSWPKDKFERILKHFETDIFWDHQKTKYYFQFIPKPKNQIPYYFQFILKPKNQISYYFHYSIDYLLRITNVTYQKLSDNTKFSLSKVQKQFQKTIKDEQFQKSVKQLIQILKKIDKYLSHPIDQITDQKNESQQLIRKLIHFLNAIKQDLAERNRKEASQEIIRQLVQDLERIEQLFLEPETEKTDQKKEESPPIRFFYTLSPPLKPPTMSPEYYSMLPEYYEALEKAKKMIRIKEAELMKNDENFQNRNRLKNLLKDLEESKQSQRQSQSQSQRQSHSQIVIPGSFNILNPTTTVQNMLNLLESRPGASNFVYFRRNLPILPKIIEFPYLILNSKRRQKKERYFFRVQNVKKMNQILDPIAARRKEKFKKQFRKIKSFIRSTDKLKLYELFEGLFGDIGFSNLLYPSFGEKFMTEEDENTEITYFCKLLYYKPKKSLYRIFRGMKTRFKKPYPYPVAKKQTKKEREDQLYFESYKERQEREYFEKTDFEQVIDDFFNFFCEDQEKFFYNPIIPQPIYKNTSIRRMSGYLYPDMVKTKNIHELSITNIPIFNFNNENYIQLENEETGELDSISLMPKPNQSAIFRNVGLPFNREFFELREYTNEYSLALLFLFSSGWLFIHIFKNLYTKYAKEIIESCINVLKYIGILHDVKWIKEELGMAPRNKGYRGIRNHSKKFKNVVGLKYIIIKIYEMVWFLKTKRLLTTNLDPFVHFYVFVNKIVKKNKSKNKSNIYTEIFPNFLKKKGFLFIGPPGTGKTLFVQAIAGESKVPVVTQSGGLLQNPKLRGKGAGTIHKLFARAHEISPCIVFIDELDAIATRRQFLSIEDDASDIITFIENSEKALPPNIFKKKIRRKKEFYDDLDPYWKEPEFTQKPESFKIPLDVLQELQSMQLKDKEQVSMLIQLLVELDGINPLKDIIIISATNRFESLDPALMRPGRFQSIFKFYLPNYTVRKKLFKFYTKSSKIGTKNISWDYFAKRTYSLTSATIAAIISSSELTAISKSTKHTYKTLEKGINLITTITNDELKFRLKNIFKYLRKLNQTFFFNNNFYFLNSSSQNLTFNSTKLKLTNLDLNEITYILRNCYYNIGKILIGFSIQPGGQLVNIDPYINLWERPKNFRFNFLLKNFNEFLEIEEKRVSRNEVEKKFITLFGGKVGESLCVFLPLQKFSIRTLFNFHPTFILFKKNLDQSNFGLDGEIQVAQSLIKFMVEKWYFYGEKIATEKFHPILENLNLTEYSPDREKEIYLFQATIDEKLMNLDMRNQLSRNEQKPSYHAWWMKKVTTKVNFTENRFYWLEWFRIYLPDPESSIRNIEWSSPDQYFHTVLRTPPDCMPWSYFLENGCFAIENLLFLKAFNTVFKTLYQFSEFFDLLADYLLRYEDLTEEQIQSKIYQFFSLMTEKIS
uniref:Cell division protein FTSH n=1 Tax=Chlorodesmis fastigiata TaxID=189431 RepID=A0A2P0QHB3_CHLFS|nr:cell division protein FTSH [Chlorodesmis fastigiata]ARO74155.1 cell division protein FTSH [Chlorodesmis fastigiata]